MSLPELLKNGWLIKHQTSPEEIRDLLGIADRDLADCQTPGLSPDWRFNIAYNAALQAATAALAAAGYRAERTSHHYRVIQTLADTIGADESLVTQFDQFRKKRNLSDYDRAGMVSDQEVREVLDLARKLRQSVEKWLKSKHPKLLPK
ncbi:MAG: HEPN domain-containing protein [Proteobacteria bacterium]|nr:HEPN domain-containing protein [Pseudomonadota bacterium]